MASGPGCAPQQRTHRPEPRGQTPPFPPTAPSGYAPLDPPVHRYCSFLFHSPTGRQGLHPRHCKPRRPVMDLQIKRKKTLVTGSTGGIGLEIARKLAMEGASIVLS